MMLFPKIMSEGALHTVNSMVYIDTRVQNMGIEDERAIRIRQRRRDVEGNRAERLGQSDTNSRNAGRCVGLSLVAGVVS